MVILGAIVHKINYINTICLTEYKTYIIKKHINPQVKRVGKETYWNNINNIHIGDNTYINGAELLTTDDTNIDIGDNCLISYNVVIRTDMHNYSNLLIPIIEQGNSSESIKIGNNVWIGYGVYIMPGVNIGDNSIIGAHAVVTKSIPPNSVAVGVPARVIKERV